MKKAAEARRPGRPACGLLLALAWATAAAAPGDFSGTWTGLLCPQDVAASPERCASLVLTLYQKEDQLCGAHLYATVGAREMDEGHMPSLVGSTSENTASVQVESGRATPPLALKVELKLEGGRLSWRRLESPAGNYLLPRAMRLTHAQQASFFNPLFEQQLSAICNQQLNAALAAKTRPPDAAPEPVPDAGETAR